MDEVEECGLGGVLGESDPTLPSSSSGGGVGSAVSLHIELV